MDDLKGFIWTQVMALRPSFMSKTPHFNFISVHYFWIIGLTILGSVLIFASGTSGNGSIPYIDALFFAAGANTQAGLNTIDANLLNTFQQLVIYFLCMLANPITINSFVVFLRLYWFEKRFQNIVREARQRRGTISKSKSKAKADFADAEKGVNGRHITVMRNGTKSRITNDGILLDVDPDHEEPHADSDLNGRLSEDRIDPKATVSSPLEGRRPEIKFATTVKRSDGLGDDAIKLPPQRADEEHIAILERQRAGDDEVLRIPGPRDTERGMRPARIEQGADEEPEPFSRARRPSSIASDTSPRVNGGPPRPQAITIEEPEPRPRTTQTKATAAKDDMMDDARAMFKTFSFLRLRKPRFLGGKSKKDKLHHEENALHFTPSGPRRRPTFETLRTAFSRDKEDPTPYLSWEPTLGRNSAFPDLSEEQREELGGIEYRSLKTLALILTVYFWGFSAFGVICLTPWIIRSSTYGTVVDADGQNRAWWGFFTSNSAFNDLGITLTPDSMNSFNTAVFPLLVMSFLIVIGNTGFPIMLRFIIWVSSILVPRGSGLWEELRFLLDHPRRCFTLLFPSAATWWLFWLLVILNGIDLLFFIILDLGSGPVDELPAGIRVLDGFFQAISTRTAGFSCINLAVLHPGVQTSYMIMMYISVFPIAISVRRTNVYEEKSLGVYSKTEVDEPNNASDLSYVGAHLRRQLSFDLWYIFIGFFIITISEGPAIQRGDFSMFAALFEIVSAYGTVGLSLGYNGINASLSAEFTVVGKLVIIAMMIRGRHRGLPYGLDRAILLPSESLNEKEAKDADARQAIHRRNSAVSVATASGSMHRGRSRSIDRTNIITSFLHPGPSVLHDAGMHMRRATTEARDADESPYALRPHMTSPYFHSRPSQPDTRPPQAPPFRAFSE